MHKNSYTIENQDISIQCLWEERKQEPLTNYKSQWLDGKNCHKTRTDLKEPKKNKEKKVKIKARLKEDSIKTTFLGIPKIVDTDSHILKIGQRQDY